MSESEPENTLAAAHAARLRKIGLIVLGAGFVIAGLLYFFGPDGTSPDDNILMTDFYKKQDSDTQRMWGNSGSLVLGITRSFRRASTYSIIIVIISAVVCFACFFLADHPRDEAVATKTK